MTDINYKVIKDYGVVADHGKNVVKLQLVSWNNNTPKFDLRFWTRTIDDKGEEHWYAVGGVTMNKQELAGLNEVIDAQLTPGSSISKTKPIVKITETKTLTDICKEIEKKSAVKKKNVATGDKLPKDTTTDNTEKKSADIKKKSYKNAYEKFKDQFSTYRKSQPDNRQKGYELTHNLILDHIKTICETSDEYNKNAMQEWKNSGDMMRFCQNKAFESAEEFMNVETREETIELMMQWIDEYIGDTSDQPKPKSKCGRKKKGA